jgi:guanylate kinase
MKTYPGHVIIVMAPTGGGKGTLIKHALSVYPHIYVTVSCTTRAMRPGEVDGREYHFISSADFDKKIANGEFLEWAHFGLNRYGTLRSEVVPRLENGEIVIAEIELQGVEQLHRLLPSENITTIYIEAGDWETLAARARARAVISDEELEKRYERYLVEIQSKNVADIVLDNTHSTIDPAREAFIHIIASIINRQATA